MTWHKAAPGYFTRAVEFPSDSRVLWAIMRSQVRPWTLYRVDGSGGAWEYSHHWTLLGAKRAARKA